MKLSVISTVLIGAGVMLGCASNKPFADMQIVPHTSTKHGAKSAAGYYALARYFHGSARLADADKAYGDALRLEPGHADALAGLGMVRSEQGRHVEAISLLRSAAARAPRSASVLNNLGFALMAGGEPRQAVVELDKALAAAPDSTRIRNNLKLAHEALKKVPGTTVPGKVPALTESAEAKNLPTLLQHPVEAVGLEPAGDFGQAITSKTVPSITLDTKPVAIELQTNVVRVAPAIYSVEYGLPGNANHTGANGEGFAQVASVTASRPTQSTRPAGSPGAVRQPSGIAEPVQIATDSGKADVCDGFDKKPQGKSRLEVQNGNGTTGMAKTVGNQLDNPDMKLVRLSNKTPFDVPLTIVEFSKGKQAEACFLAARLSLSAPRENPNLAPNVDVRLVLGRDLRHSEALLSRNSEVIAMSRRDVSH